MVEIDAIEDISKRLPFASPQGICVACKSSQIIEGLLLAKFARKHLSIDESAPPLPTKHLHGGEGIVLIRKRRGAACGCSDQLHPFAINADVLLVPRLTGNRFQSVPIKLHEWSQNNSRKFSKTLGEKFRRESKGINFLPIQVQSYFLHYRPSVRADNKESDSVAAMS